MDTKTLMHWLSKPKRFEAGTHFMWEEPFIQKALLGVHLNPDVDAASRKKNDIETTIAFIDSLLLPKQSILDLGCGPGLYTSMLAQLGYHVSGIDVNQTSIDYAKSQDILTHYKVGNYLTEDYGGPYDLITLIYCDFGVLNPNEQSIVLDKAYQALRSGGKLLLDGYSKHYVSSLKETQSMQMHDSGFFTDKPHIELFARYTYPDDAFVETYVILEETMKVYRFYNHALTLEKLQKPLKSAGFSEVSLVKVLPTEDIHFFLATKK